MKQNIQPKTRFLFLLLLCMIITGSTPDEPNVLTPETANEARLNRLQPPEVVMDAIGLKPGMTVAEIGAGRGRFVVQLAARVGEKGRVYAEDIDADALKYLESRCRKWELKNVESILGEENDPKLPSGELDMIFIISSYHHFSDPVKLLKTARPSLKPEGVLAIVEWMPRPERNYKTPAQIEREMKTAGYRLKKKDPLLKENNLMVYIFSPYKN